MQIEEPRDEFEPADDSLNFEDRGVSLSTVSDFSMDRMPKKNLKFPYTFFSTLNTCCSYNSSKHIKLFSKLYNVSV